MGESPGYAGSVVCEASVIRVVGAGMIEDSSETGAAEVEAVDVSGASGVLVAKVDVSGVVVVEAGS